MGDTHQLINKLKPFKLGGILDNLKLRLKQAHCEGLRYIEFLEFLLEEEIQRRASRRLRIRVNTGC